MRALKSTGVNHGLAADGSTAYAKRGLLAGLVVLAGVWAGTPVIRAADADPADPMRNLVDLMLQKGMLSKDEATKLQAEAEARSTNQMAAVPESMWKISKGIKDIEIYGDARLRFEDRKAIDPAGGDILLQRFRYALRLGLRGEVFDDFYYGFRVETSANPRSTWVTMGTQSGSSAAYQGPFGKSAGGIDIGQIYLGWHPESWFEITAGKMPNPLYTSSMIWSPSINPEGLAEHLKYTVGEADFFANFGQFLYQDVNPVQSSSGFFNSLNGGYTGSNMPFLLAWQAGMDYHVTKKVDLKVAPALYNYTARGDDISTTAYVPDFGGTYIGQGGAIGYNSGFGSGLYDGYYANQTGINSLLVLDIPFELNFHLENYDLRFFGDYAQNLDGSQRAQAAYLASQSSLFVTDNTPIAGIPSPQSHDDKAYQFGVAFGSKNSLGLVNGTTSQKHSWEVRTYWQHIEQYSLDPNLLDLDFFSGQENLAGIYASVAYAFTDNFIGNFRYGYASRINDQLGTGGSGTDIPQMNPVNEYQIFQVDLTFRF